MPNSGGVDDYWNHNTAYHPWLLGIAARRGGHVLDVGCGDGLLAQRLASVSRSVTAIDPDSAAAQRASVRLAAHPHVAVSHTTFENFDARDRRFDLITFVASLHHMNLRASIAKARALLTPTGEIAVVGLSANKSLRDWLWSALCVLPVRIGSRVHSEIRDVGVVVTNPREGLDEIRRTASEVIPGVSVRRALYFRYLLYWADGSIHSTA